MLRRGPAQGLRDAQARACAGVSRVDRDVSPFAHVKDITSVEPLDDGKRLLGAKVDVAIATDDPDSAKEVLRRAQMRKQ